MSLGQWLTEASKSELSLPDDGECVLLDAEDKHYLTILEQNSFVMFRYSIYLENNIEYAYRDALILNSNPNLLGKATLSLGNEPSTLVLTVFSAVSDTQEFENFLLVAEEIRDTVLQCLGIE